MTGAVGSGGERSTGFGEIDLTSVVGFGEKSLEISLCLRHGSEEHYKFGKEGSKPVLVILNIDLTSVVS